MVAFVVTSSILTGKPRSPKDDETRYEIIESIHESRWRWRGDQRLKRTERHS